MWYAQRKVVASILSFILLGLVVYGAMTNYFIKEGGTLKIQVLDTDFAQRFPESFTKLDSDLSMIHGIQNGISLSGRVIWGGVKWTWLDYVNGFPDGIIKKVLWLVFGLIIEFFINFFIHLVVFFMFIYKLFFLGGTAYKVALIISSCIPPLLAVLVSIIQPDDDLPSLGDSQPTVPN
ncbi:hypothetical protein MKX34_17150 [Paenibacillus sp. FSL R5-0636]|uniref:hypothetical protein n=1 Tax=Paenibacillus TaxID=44249 RepID=UPI00096DE67F|nr:hypothetical protein [Paenibacillus odorifer]OMD03490.1 hypothetical protein BJP49_01355 [Paenibacillus odorifer]